MKSDAHGNTGSEGGISGLESGKAGRGAWWAGKAMDFCCLLASSSSEGPKMEPEEGGGVAGGRLALNNETLTLLHSYCFHTH